MKISKHISKKLAKMMADSDFYIELAIGHREYGGWYYSSIDTIVKAFEIYLETDKNILDEILVKGVLSGD